MLLLFIIAGILNDYVLHCLQSVKLLLLIVSMLHFAFVVVLLLLCRSCYAAAIADPDAIKVLLVSGQCMNISRCNP